MKKVLTKIMSVCLILTFLLSSISISASAEIQYGMGLIWEDCSENINDELVKSISYLRACDVDGNGVISASDARIILRASVNLEQLSENQKVAADINKDYIVSAFDARYVLRFSVGLEEPVKFTLVTNENNGFIIGPLSTSGSGKYSWSCIDEKEGFLMKEYILEEKSDKEGAGVQQFFIFSAQKAGSYNLRFILSDINKNEIIDEFCLNVIVNMLPVEINAGEKYTLTGLKNAGSGLYNWFCEISPIDGLTVSSSFKSDSSDEVVGTPVEQIFVFIGEKSGLYIAHFEKKSFSGEIIDEFYMEIAVK